MSPQVAAMRPSLEPPVPAFVPVRSAWPVYADDEIAAVTDILRSGRVNALQHGTVGRAFEAAMAAQCRMPHAIALANGTLALELALHALGIGPGDEVIVTPRSFVASAACVVTQGAVPVFADVDPDSQNITAQSIARVMSPRTRAIVAVHLAGWPCAMDEIMTLAQAHDLRVIEDCAQAHGATYDGAPVGSFGDAATFSFCTDKIISTGGEGGMLLLRDAEAFGRAWAMKDHGKSRAALARPATGHVFRWLHESIGSNYRLTEMQAAIGMRQLGKLGVWTAQRRANAALLGDCLGDVEALRVPEPSQITGHARYKFYAFVRPERLRAGWDRDRLVAELHEVGVPAGSGTCPEIYREAAFVAAGLGPAQPLPVAQRLGETSLMLPVDPTLGAEAMTAMGERLRDLVIGVSR